MDSRKFKDFRRRRYQCVDCGEKFSTVEVRVDNMKRGGGYRNAYELLREDFSMTHRQQDAIGELIQSFLETEDE